MEEYDENAGVWDSSVVPDGAAESDRMSVDFITPASGFDVRTGGGGAHDGYLGLHGNSALKNKVRQILSFGDIAQSVGTLCTTSRYEPGGKKGYIFYGGRTIWLHGHFRGSAKVAKYGNYGYHWYSHPHDHPAVKTTDWIVMCSTNGGDQEIWVNGDDNAPLRANSRPVANEWNQGEIFVGKVGRLNQRTNREPSEYRIGEVIAWNRGFKSDELQDVTQYLIDRLAGSAT
jgi:hypothetical protein